MILRWHDVHKSYVGGGMMSSHAVHTKIFGLPVACCCLLLLLKYIGQSRIELRLSWIFVVLLNLAEKRLIFT